MIEETFNFIKNLLPYIFSYSFLFISIILTITFFLSSWLHKKDDENFNKRKNKIEEELIFINEIKDLVKEKDLSIWIKDKYEEKREKINTLTHLKDISPIRVKKYFKKGIISLIFVVISSFCYYQLYQYDIQAHQPSTYFNSYSDISDKELENIKIKEEDFNSFKHITVVDKEQSVEYFYIVKENEGNIKNLYYSQSIIIPQLLQTIFMIVYILFIAFVRYVSRLIF